MNTAGNGDRKLARRSAPTRLLVVGAGWPGSPWCGRSRPMACPVQPVAFLDDDPELIGPTFVASRSTGGTA